jgi:hypothetical protein
VPADAYSADVTVSVNIPAKDFTVAALEKKGVEIKR